MQQEAFAKNSTLIKNWIATVQLLHYSTVSCTYFSFISKPQPLLWVWVWFISVSALLVWSLFCSLLIKDTKSAVFQSKIAPLRPVSNLPPSTHCQQFISKQTVHKSVTWAVWFGLDPPSLYHPGEGYNKVSLFNGKKMSKWWKFTVIAGSLFGVLVE